jgi:biopolymer transport protein ExbD
VGPVRQPNTGAGVGDGCIPTVEFFPPVSSRNVTDETSVTTRFGDFDAYSNADSFTMSAAGKKRRASLKPICHIDMTAFLSIQLVLLFMFMIVVSDWHDLPLNTTANPVADHPVLMRGANREDAMIVAVQRTGDVWLGYQRVMVDELPMMIQERVRQGSERKVYINADRYANYSRIREVLAAVHSGGVENVAFLVYQRNTNTGFQSQYSRNR